MRSGLFERFRAARLVVGGACGPCVATRLYGPCRRRRTPGACFAVRVRARVVCAGPGLDREFDDGARARTRRCRLSRRGAACARVFGLYGRGRGPRRANDATGRGAPRFPYGRVDPGRMGAGTGARPFRVVDPCRNRARPSLGGLGAPRGRIRRDACAFARRRRARASWGCSVATRHRSVASGRRATRPRRGGGPRVSRRCGVALARVRLVEAGRHRNPSPFAGRLADRRRLYAGRRGRAHRRRCGAGGGSLARERGRREPAPCRDARRHDHDPRRAFEPLGRRSARAAPRRFGRTRSLQRLSENPGGLRQHGVFRRRFGRRRLRRQAAARSLRRIRAARLPLVRGAPRDSAFRFGRRRLGSASEPPVGPAGAERGRTHLLRKRRRRRA